MPARGSGPDSIFRMTQLFKWFDNRMDMFLVFLERKDSFATIEQENSLSRCAPPKLGP